MKFGISLPPFGPYSDARYLATIAREAEDLGWDGVFIWDHVFFDPSFHPNLDPWVGLAAIAMNTSRIRIGTLVTPVARRRPWILARQTVSVDRLSNGRLTLGIGLGDPVQWDYGFFDEETDAKVRAAKLDEGLEVLTGLWTGEPFSYDGKQFKLKQVKFVPIPSQSPRIPIWVGGNFGKNGPMRRAARWDGYNPIKWETGMAPEDWRQTMAFIRSQRKTDSPFDAVHGGRVPQEQWHRAAQVVEPFADAGVTWWIEDVSPWRFGHSWEIQWQPEFTQQMNEVIRRGPPNL